MASKMGKILKFLVLAVIIVIIAAVLLFKFFGERAITVAAETAGTKALGVPVNIDSIGLKLSSGSGSISGLSINNPAGFANEYLMQMDNGDVQINTKSLFSDKVIIDKVHLSNLHITFEQKGLKSNVQVINDNLSKIKPEKPDEPAKEPTDKKGKKVVISDFQIVNSKLSIKLLPIPGKVDTVTVSLPDIKLTDVGEGESMNFEQVVEYIFVAISEAIAKAGSGIIPDDLLGSLNSSIEGALNIVGGAGESLINAGSGILQEGEKAGKAITEGATEAGKKITEGASDAGKTITEGASKTLEGIGNIFGGKKSEEPAKEE